MVAGCQPTLVGRPNFFGLTGKLLVGSSFRRLGQNFQTDQKVDIFFSEKVIFRCGFKKFVFTDNGVILTEFCRLGQIFPLTKEITRNRKCFFFSLVSKVCVRQKRSALGRNLSVGSRFCRLGQNFAYGKKFQGGGCKVFLMWFQRIRFRQKRPDLCRFFWWGGGGPMLPAWPTFVQGNHYKCCKNPQLAVYSMSAPHWGPKRGLIRALWGSRGPSRTLVRALRLD